MQSTVKKMLTLILTGYSITRILFPTWDVNLVVFDKIMIIFFAGLIVSTIGFFLNPYFERMTDGKKGFEWVLLMAIVVWGLLSKYYVGLHIAGVVIRGLLLLTLSLVSFKMLVENEHVLSLKEALSLFVLITLIISGGYYLLLVLVTGEIVQALYPVLFFSSMVFIPVLIGFIMVTLFDKGVFLFKEKIGNKYVGIIINSMYFVIGFIAWYTSVFGVLVVLANFVS